MSDYWKAFWDEHSQLSERADPQIQVLRTCAKQPVSEAIFREILASMSAVLDLRPEHRLLDMCCGNGLVAQHLAPFCREVVAVDFAKELLTQIDTASHPNITPLHSDAGACEFENASFDRIVLNAAIQYFSHQEAVVLLESMFDWLPPNGLLFIGDIPDRDAMWQFFNTYEREAAFFDALKSGRPIIGTWYGAEWLQKLALYVGFTLAEIVKQPAHFPYSHFRFDLVLKKAERRRVGSQCTKVL